MKHFLLNFTTSKFFTLLIICFLTLLKAHAQIDTSKYTFKITHEQKSKTGRLVEKSDTLYLTFLYSYENDTILIRANDKVFTSGRLNAQNLYGIGGRLKIPKKDLKGKADIFFNNKFLAKIKVNKKYTSVHLVYDSENNSFQWRYLRYRFSFL